MKTARQSSLDLVTVDEVADMLGKSPQSIRWMRHTGELPTAAKIGGRVVWKRQQILDWVDQQFASQPA